MLPDAFVQLVTLSPGQSTSGGCKFAVQGCEWYRLPERQFQVRGIVDGQAMGPR